ncbi:MAG: beta-N-acetylhexosaminidase [Saprospiraceae bacterium]|nr:beta-N-acetylhexosaminidase [Saprospiraceae bacterium]
MKYFSLIVLLSCALTNTAISQEKANPPGIIPLPQQLQWLGYSIPVKNIGVSDQKVWPQLNQLIRTLLPLTLNPGAKAEYSLEILKDTLMGSESYSIDIANRSILLKAGDYKGAVYGIQTLNQMTILQANVLMLQAATVSDQPRFPYRGMHLDVSRHFFPVPFIKKYLRMMSRYKMNTFHWHLTDDQGWRIEIKKYPLLQKVAAWRNKTLIGHAGQMNKKFSEKKYGGFYTQEEVKEVVSFASALGIEVIPEIEMPGHASAAVAAYPELGCTNEYREVVGEWGVFEDVFCPSEITFQFLEDVVDEILPLFPSSYIHIGGDECPKKQWQTNSLCQELIRTLDLKDEHGLQSYFIKRMEKYINAKGKKIIGWDEILEGGLAPNATVMSWRGIEGGIAAARQGHDVIMTPTDHCYLDYYQSNSANEPLSIGGYLPLEKVYSYNPVPSDLDSSLHHHILGTQGNVWTEYLPNEQRVWYQVLPRMLAIAENGWTYLDKKNLSHFLERLNTHFPYWQSMGLNAADKRYELYYQITEGDGKSIGLEIASKGGTLMPQTYKNGNLLAPLQNNIRIKETCTITSLVKEGSFTKDSLSLDFQWHKAAGSKIEVEVAPDDRYTAFGPVTLVDGLKGDVTSHKNGWLGFNKTELSFQLSLPEPVQIDTLIIGFYHNHNQWIHAPSIQLIELVVENNENINHRILSRTGNHQNSYLVMQPFTAKNLHIKIYNTLPIPQGLPGEGNVPWVFIDEIRLK